MAAAFDTLKYAKQLKQAGVPENQAEIHAEALRGVLEEQIMARFDRVDDRFDQVGERFSKVDSDLRQLDNRLSRVEANLEHLIKVVYGVVIGILLLLVRGFWPA